MRGVVSLSLLALVSSLCSFTQQCGEDGCKPPTMISPPTPPIVEKYTENFMCPEMAGQALCCNDVQNSQLVTKFQLIDYTFGGGAGGCDACGANLKRLWCSFTCSPEQSTFVQGGPQEFVLDPMSSTPSWVLVMPTNFTVTERYACELYNSCKKCPYAQQVSAMQSSHGFLQFQGANSVEMGLVYITFYFVNVPPALEMTVTPCSSQASELYGYPAKPCSCNKCVLGSCDPLCNHHITTPTLATLSGMNWVMIGVCYLVIFVITLIVLFLQYMWMRRARKRRGSPQHANAVQLEDQMMDPYDD